jgi:hypothetical protein
MVRSHVPTRRGSIHRKNRKDDRVIIAGMDESYAKDITFAAGHPQRLLRIAHTYSPGFGA